MWSASKEIASGLCVSYLPWHTNQGTLVAISYLKREKERGRKEERKKKRKDAPILCNKVYSRGKSCFWWPHPDWLLARGRKSVLIWELEKCLYAFMLGNCAVLWIIDRDPVLEKNRIFTFWPKWKRNHSVFSMCTEIKACRQNFASQVLLKRCKIRTHCGIFRN